MRPFQQHEQNILGLLNKIRQDLQYKVPINEADISELEMALGELRYGSCHTRVEEMHASMQNTKSQIERKQESAQPATKKFLVQSRKKCDELIHEMNEADKVLSSIHELNEVISSLQQQLRRPNNQTIRALESAISRLPELFETINSLWEERGRIQNDLLQLGLRLKKLGISM